MEAELGLCRVAQEQRTRVEPVRREWPKFVLPEPDAPAGAQFARNEAERRDQIAGPAAVREAWAWIVFRVNNPDLVKRQFPPIRAAGRRRGHSPAARSQTSRGR